MFLSFIGSLHLINGESDLVGVGLKTENLKQHVKYCAALRKYTQRLNNQVLSAWQMYLHLLSKGIIWYLI